MKERPSSFQIASLVLCSFLVNIKNAKGSPFPDPQLPSSWFFSGPGLQLQEQQLNPFGNFGSSGNCHQMNIYCSGHTMDSCQRYCHHVGFPQGSCQGSCCLCSHSPLGPDYGTQNQNPFLIRRQQQQPPKLDTTTTSVDIHPQPQELLDVAESQNINNFFYPINSNKLQEPNGKNIYKPWSNKKTTHLEKNEIYQEKSIKNHFNHISQPNKTLPTCQTEACIKAAKRLEFNMNRNANPCNNFYEYACGGFVKNAQIPPDEVEVTTFTSLRNKVSEQLRHLIEEPIRQNEPKSFGLVKTLYKSCMNTARLDVLGPEPLNSVLVQLGGWPVLDPVDEQQYYSPELFNWSNYVVWLRELGFSHDIFMKISVDTDIKNVTRRLITIGEPTLGLEREVLIKGLNDPSVVAYYKFMVDTAVYMGASKQLAEKDMLQVLNFEITLAKSFYRPDGTRASGYYVPITISEMEGKHAYIPWLELFQRVLPKEVTITSNEVVIISAPHYMDTFFGIVSSADTKTIANYAVWRMVSSSMSYMDESARKLVLEFTTATTGQRQSVPRWKKCTDIVSSSMGNAVGAMYIRRHFPPSAKAEAEEMIRNIHQAFIQILNKVEWMDSITKEKAKEKALGISIHVGYPEQHKTDGPLDKLYHQYKFNEQDFLGNVRNLVLSATDLAFGTLKHRIIRNNWAIHGKNAEVNAFYMPLDNAIQFPAGILQNPFFDNRRPRYLNYGAIGWVAGHEVSHGFDDQGHQFDKDGNYANWWDPFTKQTYITRTKCIINQYGQFSPAGSGLKLNGINSQGENIADNGGIKQAYRGYQSWVQKHGVEPTLPGFENLTANQLFWISAASNWCSIMRPQRLRTHILTGVHSPGEFRVRGTFANNEDFALDFACPRGSSMNPKLKCSVW